MSNSSNDLISIRFEDHGQDFLEWLVEEKTGKVIFCSPYQGDIWCGCIVYKPFELTKGSTVFFCKNPNEPSRIYQINYPVERIGRILPDEVTGKRQSIQWEDS